MELKHKKKILLISSGQPSLNPRLVKEADILAEMGYDVTVLYAYWNYWGTKFDKELIPTKKWKAICIGGDPQQKKLAFFFSRLIFRLAKMISRQTKGKYFAEFAITRAGYFLSRETRKHNADIYIGHNLGALPAIVKAAKINKKPSGFDAEDFHRFEVSDDVNDPDVNIKTHIENKYIPRVDYLSASSPLIAEAYKQLFPTIDPTVILNVFPANLNIKQPVLNKTGTIKLFWFSQTIGTKRGLENVLTTLERLKDHSFELHILGQLSDEMKHMFIEYKDSVNIHVHQPIPPDDIVVFASQFNIGLTTENAYPLNRDICLTNKTFIYLRAGLAIAASDTKAQSALLNKYLSIGKVYQKDDPWSLANTLLYYDKHREELFETQKAAFTIANEELNWENESKKFLKLVEQTLNKN